MFKFGVDTFIWSEHFTGKDLPLVEKAKPRGIKVLDIAIVHPEEFPTELVKEKVKEVAIVPPLHRYISTLRKMTSLLSPVTAYSRYVEMTGRSR